MSVNRIVRSFLGYLIPVAVVSGLLYWYYRVPPSLQSDEIKIVVEDQVVPLKNLENGPLLVNFYASWCGPCMNELPSLSRAHGMGVFRVIGVTDDGPELITKVAERYRVDYPLYRLDRSLDDYGVHSIPTSYLINSNGEIVLSINGVREWDSDEFQQMAIELLEVP